MSSIRASYEIMASPPIFSMSPGMSSGLADLFLLIITNRFLIILVLIVKGSYTCDVFYFRNVTIVAEYRNIIVV